MAKQEDKLKQLQQDYKNTFSTDEGKRVLEDLKLRGFYYSSTFTGDANGMIWNEGMRAIVLTIISMIEQPYDEIIKLVGQEPEEEKGPFE